MINQCACGQDLHYEDSELRETVEGLIRDLGPTVKIEYQGHAWAFQRHFVALHGQPRGKDIPTIAIQYGFKEVKPTPKPTYGPKKRNKPVDDRPVRY